jgi:hypothetical protein
MVSPASEGDAEAAAVNFRGGFVASDDVVNRVPGDFLAYDDLEEHTRFVDSDVNGLHLLGKVAQTAGQRKLNYALTRLGEKKLLTVASKGAYLGGGGLPYGHNEPKTQSAAAGDT